MPEMDGLEFSRKLQTLPPFPTIQTARIIAHSREDLEPQDKKVAAAAVPQAF